MIGITFICFFSCVIFPVIFGGILSLLGVTLFFFPVFDNIIVDNGLLLMNNTSGDGGNTNNPGNNNGGGDGGGGGHNNPQIYIKPEIKSESPEIKSETPESDEAIKQSVVNKLENRIDDQELNNRSNMFNNTGKDTDLNNIERTYLIQSWNNLLQNDTYTTKNYNMKNSELTETGKNLEEGSLLEKQASGKYASTPNTKTKLNCAIEGANHGRDR